MPPLVRTEKKAPVTMFSAGDTYLTKKSTWSPGFTNVRASSTKSTFEKS